MTHMVVSFQENDPNKKSCQLIFPFANQGSETISFVTAKIAKTKIDFHVRTAAARRNADSIGVASKMSYHRRSQIKSLSCVLFIQCCVNCKKKRPDLVTRKSNSTPQDCLEAFERINFLGRRFFLSSLS